MSKRLLKKVIAELGKENPDLSYIRGILETMDDAIPEEYSGAVSRFEAKASYPEMHTTTTSVIPDPEGQAIDNMASSRLSEILKASQIDEIN